MDTDKRLAEIGIQLERLANQFAELRNLIEISLDKKMVDGFHPLVGEVNEVGDVDLFRDGTLDRE